MNVEPGRSFPPWAFPVLFVVGFVAGFVDSIAGGGGLLTIPALLGFNVPAQLALGTGKLQASFGSGSAAWHYRKLKVVSVRECLMGAGFTIIGASYGTYLSLTLKPELLKQLIPVLLMGVALYMIFKP